MGFAISWLAFEHRRPEEVHRLLELQPNGETSDVPEDKFNGATLPGGWYLVFINQTDHAFVRPKRLAGLSAGGRVIAVSVEEHVMVCWAAAWHNGREVWSVAHNAEGGLDDLRATGELPANYAGIRARLMAEQAAEDAGDRDVDCIFDVPLELAQSIAGYKHDQDDELEFETLVPRASEKRGFFARLFG